MSLEIVTIVGGPIQTNAYLVADTATGDALVIDAPHETASQIVEEAARRGWNIGQIVITHTHWDHILDAKALQQATGVPLLAHPLARSDWPTRRQTSASRRWKSRRWRSARP